MSERKANISPEHFSWLVEGRSANQQSTLTLYEIINGNEYKFNGNAELLEAAQELTGAAFSLWRSVFLSDTSGEFEEQFADLQKFLVSLISDNTILYVTDKNARNWSFRYYLDNAVHRLRKLSEGSLALVDAADLSKVASSEKDEWLDAQDILDKAIQKFRNVVDVAV